MCLGIPGRIIRLVDAERAVGIVDVGGIQRTVSLSCVVSASTDVHQLINCWVLVHVGFAMSIIDEAEANATLAVLTELGEMQNEILAMQEGAS